MNVAFHARGGDRRAHRVGCLRLCRQVPHDLRLRAAGKNRHLIDKEKDAISLLRAEFAHLARPDRIQALAASKLGLQPLALSQIATVDELPEAQPKVNSIGRTLEITGLYRRQLDAGRHRRQLDPAGEVVRDGRGPERHESESQRWSAAAA